jgi:phosphate transport system substrate-binding protein
LPRIITSQKTHYVQKDLSNNYSFCGILILSLGVPEISAQTPPREVVISGARFASGIFESWIEEYRQLYPEVEFRIEDKGAAEFSDADLIIHGYRVSNSETDKSREYITIARYAILIVSNDKSPFAQYYGRKGINRDQIKQIFFFDPVENGDKPELKMPFQVYTRVQLAPSPIVFAACFGYDQQHIHGRAIAGSDLHLVKSVQRDSLGITYLPLPLVYSPETGKTIGGIAVIPVDYDGNGRITDDELI